MTWGIYIGIITACLILFFLFIFGKILGQVWVWIGGILGVSWIISESAYLTELVSPASGIFSRITALLMPQTAGPLTVLIRDTISFMPGIVAEYTDMFQNMDMTGDLNALAVLILKIFGLSIILPLPAAVYCNAELVLILIIANTARRIVRRQMKKRNAEKTQAASGEGGKRTPETVQKKID